MEETAYILLLLVLLAASPDTSTAVPHLTRLDRSNRELEGPQTGRSRDDWQHLSDAIRVLRNAIGSLPDTDEEMPQFDVLRDASVVLRDANQVLRSATKVLRGFHVSSLQEGALLLDRDLDNDERTSRSQELVRLPASKRPTERLPSRLVGLAIGTRSAQYEDRNGWGGGYGK